MKDYLNDAMRLSGVPRERFLVAFAVLAQEQH